MFDPLLAAPSLPLLEQPVTVEARTKDVNNKHKALFIFLFPPKLSKNVFVFYFTIILSDTLRGMSNVFFFDKISVYKRKV